MQLIVLGILKFFASSIIQKQNPFIIGITGTVGKTSTRHFISSFLAEKGADFSTPQGNYNGEFGLPLSIIQARSGGKNPLSWLLVFFKGALQMYNPKYPKILVLEYGIDRPGEMKFMCGIVEPDIAVFTTLSANHIQQFGTEQAYFEEKYVLARQKRKVAQMVVCNADDENQKPIIATDTFGKNEEATLRVVKVTTGSMGLDVTYSFSGNEYLIQTSYFGEHNIYTLSPAILALTGLGYELPDILKTLSTISLPQGRGNTLMGHQQTCIIDGSYNGGYASILAGINMLETVASEQGKKSIAIIGDMRELGPLEKDRHKKLAEFCTTKQIDQFVFVGPLSSRYIQPSLPRAVFTLDAREAGNYVRDILNQADPGSYVVYAKGSQNTVFLEEALAVLVEDTQQLVRRGKKWQKVRNKFFSTLDLNS